MEEKEEAIEEGFKDGIKQGIEEGIKQGIKEGIESKELEVIKNMLAEKADYEFISKVTGKTILEIKEIEKNNN